MGKSSSFLERQTGHPNYLYFSAILFENSIFFPNFVAIKRKKYGKEDFEATACGHTEL